MAAREALRLQAQVAPAARRPPAAAPAPARASAPTPRARPSQLGVPLTDLHLARLAELEQLVGPGRYAGWGREGQAADWTARTPSTWEEYFVEFLESTGATERYTGATLHLAIGAALRARKGTP